MHESLIKDGSQGVELLLRSSLALERKEKDGGSPLSLRVEIRACTKCITDVFRISLYGVIGIR